VRRLLEKSAIPEVLERLSRAARQPGSGSVRTDYWKLCASGAALDLADVIASLTELGGMNRIHGERGLLDKARRLLAREIAEVMDESESAAEARIDAALAAGGRAPHGRRKARGSP
jgi:RNA polymerase-interacting CarD/CdnL/TRCF family regulator